MSAASIKKRAADRRAAGKGPKNTSYTTADGKGVSIKNGVKTYSDKPVNVKGRSGQSISGKDYSINKGGTGYDPNPSVITSDKMAPVTPINLPTPPPVDGLFGVTDSANASLAGAVGGTYDTTNKQIVPPTPVAAPSTASDIFKSYMDKQMGAFNEQTSSVDRLKEQQKMLRPKENTVNALSGQLNTITANRDAAMLGLEGQGRGQTAGFIGGEQARINREAAIQAMPIQAQLAIAQDDLESARSYASQLFQAQAADDLARYNFQKEVNASIYNFLNAEETRRMAAKEKEEDRAFAVAQDNRSTLKQLSLQALEYGQGALAAEVMRLDPKSPTFDTDYGDAMSRLRKPAVAKEVKSPWKLQDVNGVSSWVNEDTQEVRPVGGVDGSNLKPVRDLEIRDLNDTWTAKNSITSIVDNMTKSIEENGTKIFWGAEAGKRGANKTNLLLAMKNLEKTGALDKGTIDVLADLIPENEFWATEDRQIAALNQLKDTIVSKTNEFADSYRGTTAEIDPRTKRIYGTVEPVDIANIPQIDINEVYDIFGVSQSTSSGTFNADQWLK